jgi:acyl carrier protein
VLVEVVRGDVTDPGACRTAVAAAARHAPLRTVLHLAGAIDDHAFERQTRASFEAVFAPKARGAVELYRALRDHRLDAFVLYSSASAVLGSAGQTNYAAANGFLDGLAEWLRSRGVPAVSVDWGPWLPRLRGGLAATDATERAADRLGIRPLADAEAEEVFGIALSGRRSRIVAVALHPEAAAPAGHPMATLLAPPAVRRAASGTARERGWLRTALDAPASEDRETLLLRTLRSMTGEVLGDDETVDVDLGFGDLGVDSIMALDLRDRLARALGRDLPATVAFDHPNVSALAGYVLGLLYPVPDGDPDARPRPEPSTSDDALRDLSFDELLSTVQTDVAAAVGDIPGVPTDVSTDTAGEK